MFHKLLSSSCRAAIEDSAGDNQITFKLTFFHIFGRKKLFTSLCLGNASNYNKSLSLMLSEQIKRKEDDVDCRNCELTASTHPIDKGENRAGCRGGPPAMSSACESNRARSDSWRCWNLCRVQGFRALLRPRVCKPAPTYASMQIFAEKSWLGHRLMMNSSRLPEIRHFVRKSSRAHRKRCVARNKDCSRGEREREP